MAEKYTAYIYGAGNWYNRLINHLRKCKDSLKILGIVTSLRTPYKKIDGYDCFTVENVDLGGQISLSLRLKSGERFLISF